VLLRLFENTCHTTRAVRQTLKEKENYFWYFLKISVTWCERPDRHNKTKINNNNEKVNKYKETN